VTDSALTTRIKVINPNTSLAMTRLIGTAARGVAGVGTEIIAVSPPMGPASIESHYDEALAVPGILHEITHDGMLGERIDGYVIACFGDPGLDAARELAAGPVVGIAEAAMHAATMLGRRFSVVTTLGRTTGRAWDLASHYGFREHCASVYACEVPVLELEEPGSEASSLIEALARRAIDEDEADCIVLGCAGMADLCHRLSQNLGVPVIDGVSAAVGMVETLVRMRVSTSRREEYARPRPKVYEGLLEPFGLTV
jgi:allantoin racemase